MVTNNLTAQPLHKTVALTPAGGLTEDLDSHSGLGLDFGLGRTRPCNHPGKFGPSFRLQLAQKLLYDCGM